MVMGMRLLLSVAQAFAGRGRRRRRSGRPPSSPPLLHPPPWPTPAQSSARAFSSARCSPPRAARHSATATTIPRFRGASPSASSRSRGRPSLRSGDHAEPRESALPRFRGGQAARGRYDDGDTELPESTWPRFRGDGAARGHGAARATCDAVKMRGYTLSGFPKEGTGRAMYAKGDAELPASTLPLDVHAMLNTELRGSALLRLWKDRSARVMHDNDDAKLSESTWPQFCEDRAARTMLDNMDAELHDYESSNSWFRKDRAARPMYDNVHAGAHEVRWPRFRKDRALAMRDDSDADMQQQKKKKKPPPGPQKFEELTAKNPIHSDLPFDFRYSYTEMSKVPPVKYQEQFSPFGPGRLDRDWDGVVARKRPDSESGESKLAKNTMTRDEIIGKPLTADEEKELIEECIRTKKQVNIGRDGLTHNTLIVIHHHWKRDKAVRLRCKGVSTMDMANVCFQLEDKTGGKIIHRADGTIYLFRGRYYNFRECSRIPMMLWRPHSPIYPRLLKKGPEGVSAEELNTMRKRGHKLMPLCQLAKNGYYGDLVKHAREAFEDDELVRIDCKKLNLSDMKRIAVKLRDLVPCILLCFSKAQIIAWRGRDWKSLAVNETKSTDCANKKAHALDADGCDHIQQVAMLETSSSLAYSVEQGDAHDLQSREDEDVKEDREALQQKFYDSYPELDDLDSYSSDRMSSQEVDLSDIFSSDEEA